MIDGFKLPTPVDDFKYTSLKRETRCFRLLRLLKGDTKIDVECEIFHASIAYNDVIPYEALSYTWGNTELVECIKLNRKTFWITENLHSALQCLRSRDQDRILWIDAICIDQSNDEERSQQVQKMGTIFGLAERVIFWLGKPTVEASLLLNSLNELQLSSVSSTYEGAELDETLWKKLWSNVQRVPKQQDNRQTSQQQQRKGLQVLLKRPWFRRVWVVQEVAKAQSAVVCSGTLSVPAHIFVRAPLLLELDTDAHVQSVLDIMPGPARKRSWWRRERDLFNLLIKFRASEATDTRDMVFALLGISSEPANHGLLRADYTKTVEEVIHNTVRYWFQASSISISQILHYLTGFKAVHTTYLVPLEKVANTSEGEEEVVHLTLPTSRDEAALFLLEHRRDETSKNEETCHEELDRLQSELLDIEPVHRHTLRVVSWKSDVRNVKLVIVKKATGALLLVGSHGCRRIFDFIADECEDDKQKLLDNALYEAARQGLEDVVELTLDKGADVNTPQRYDLGNALGAAASNGHGRIMQILLDRGASVNARGGPFGHVLQAVCELGNEQMVQVLLDKGANVNAQGGKYGNALQAACARGNEQIVKLLLDRGANINVKGGRCANTLHAALDHNNEKLMRMLLEKGADVNIQGGDWATPLNAASAYGYDKIVQMLIDQGADVNAEVSGRSALESAVINDCDKVVQVLLDNGANVNTECDIWNNETRTRQRGTVLESGLRVKKDKAVKVLLQYGAKPLSQIKPPS